MSTRGHSSALADQRATEATQSKSAADDVFEEARDTFESEEIAAASSSSSSSSGHPQEERLVSELSEVLGDDAGREPSLGALPAAERTNPDFFLDDALVQLTSAHAASTSVFGQEEYEDDIRTSGHHEDEASMYGSGLDGLDEDEAKPFSIASLLGPYEASIARQLLDWERQEERGRGGESSALGQRTAAPHPNPGSLASATTSKPPPPEEAKGYKGSGAKEPQPATWTETIWGWFSTSNISKSAAMAIYECLAKIESLALDSVSIQKLESDMLMYAASHGLHAIHSARDFNKFTLQQLDEIAAQYANPSYIASVVQGAGLGLGGLFFMTADIPLLLGLNCRVLAQLGYVYGGQYYSKPAMVLHLLVASCASMISVAEKDAAVAHAAAHDIAAEIQRQISLETLKRDVVTDVERGVVTELVKNISVFLAAHFTRSKLLQLIPLVGSAIGAGSNYYFTATCVRNAQMNLRRQYFDRVFGMDAVRACLSAQDDEAFAWTLVDYDEVKNSHEHPDAQKATAEGSVRVGMLVWDEADAEQRYKSLDAREVEEQLAASLHKMEDAFGIKKDNHTALTESYLSATSEKL